jgi:hypothetical protein
LPSSTDTPLTAGPSRLHRYRSFRSVALIELTTLIEFFWVSSAELIEPLSASAVTALPRLHHRGRKRDVLLDHVLRGHHQPVTVLGA